MKVIKILLTSSLLFTLNPLVVQACPKGNPASLAYIRRENNRCEGLQDYRYSSSIFELISFSTSKFSDYPNSLNIRVPGTGRTPPKVEMLSIIKNYLLDEIETRPASSGFIFSLDTTVLRQAKVPFSSLRTIAYITRDSGFVYFPVVLGQPSSQYTFVVDSPQRTTFPTFEIRRNGKTLVKKPINRARSGQIRFSWDYQNAPAGSYELYIVNGEGQSRTFRFEHNPNWL